MFKTQGTTVQTWQVSVAHKQPVQQPVPEEAAPDSPAAGFGTNAEIRQKWDYGQSPQTSNSKRRWGPEDSPGLAGHARASRRGHGMPTSALGAAGISPAPAQGTKLSPASPTPSGRQPKPAHQPKCQVSHKDTTPAPTRTAPLPGSPAATCTTSAEAVLQGQSIPVTACPCRGPARVLPAVQQPCPSGTPSSRHGRAGAGRTCPSRAAAFQVKLPPGGLCCSGAYQEARTRQDGSPL